MFKLFCNHKYMPYKRFVDFESNGTGRVRHIWKCMKCGKEKCGK